MEICMSCNKKVMFTKSFGRVVLCRSCGDLLNVPVWEERNFISMEELQNYKKNTMQLVVENGMPEGLGKEIEHYFDEYINAGFITSINGKAGQVLKIFSNYCIICTKRKEAKSKLEMLIDQMGGEDYEEEETKSDDGEFLSTKDKWKLVRGVMSGRAISTGVNVYMSAKEREEEREKEARRRAKEAERKRKEKQSKLDMLVLYGERIINYATISRVETIMSTENNTGCLKFVPKGIRSSDVYNCGYFVFSNSMPFSKRKTIKKMEGIRDNINELIVMSDRKIYAENLVSEQRKIERVTKVLAEECNGSTQKNTDAFEEIRKYKELLEDGIITEEEFNNKKKQLLGL